MPVSVPTFIKQAWAAVGSKFTIPDNANPTTGRAGWDQGFSPINLTPVAAGGIPPFGQDMNGVLYDITSAIQYIQAGRSFPFNQDFADAIGGYGKGSLVSLDSDLSVVYKSKVDNNLTPPPSANWEVLVDVVQATESVAGIAKVATLAEFDAGVSDQVFITPKKTRPSVSGSAVLTGSNNNISLVGIATSLGLEKGDVIQVVTTSYDKLHTVESIIDDDNIVVNYEHCGSRGDGSLKLPDYTGSVTIKRISKWYNAPLGLGQANVDVTSLRSPGVSNELPYKRPISVKFYIGSGSGAGTFQFSHGKNFTYTWATSATLTPEFIVSADVGSYGFSVSGTAIWTSQIETR